MKLSPGKNAPDVVNVLVEIPQGSNIKYEYDDEEGVIKVDRVLYTSMNYPFNYGFIPGTLEEDGDPLDVLVITNYQLYPGSVIEVRPIGILYMKDEEGEDAKIVAVPKDKTDPSFSNIKDINDLPQATKNKIVHFFEHYKELEPGKYVKISGWGSATEAKNRIQLAIKRVSGGQ
ncbi:inorganic diphosphatase [Sulfolobus acidocaldarius]|uniref:Inorganic pyrophosphatase n=4 Tax=Sulfolobus acidocaldarius TaxID=2285 RepID=IPYR_SULAC|nr:inorganic diphosphatase [Sulfolobus acidocaldarius]P50308.1 RecName: Full=Inorganic pyrophosphatase; AltName: Full=Pyrophosphate phospho-hydrolase; Short=PPase [Sulfolobus acidocaldarius DSM 639]1QEZ_A Chain A, PROTEIN (INORGANIC PYROPHOSPHATASE) [Sulfolobus acidocaldarius]1QEZ_B Chain B, PROTEIN (INORGANIC PYROPHOSPHATASE) [Sulfolobus acidocaldarius]1QEZ_C Chain C, PROTEIN (INORGANIC PYROPHOSPHATASE) [Sulfolobus acidocaldarius]1QEZ_D Chain D, PROTEIN (INORGANIC PYROPHOSPHATASE) [Sulfolobus